MPYYLFAGHHYSFGGGSNDFKAKFDDLQAAIIRAKSEEQNGYDWWQITDSDMNIVEEF